MSEQSYLLTVLDVVEETDDARSIVLEPPADAKEAFAYRPGQFLTVAVPGEQSGVLARAYSLSSSPVDGGPLVITVKQTPDGYASRWLAEHVRPGDTLRALPPSGIFTPPSLDADLLLIAAGSGITPVMSIIRTALAQGTGRLSLLYANSDERSVIFRGALADLAEAHPDRLEVRLWLESERGLPTQEQIGAFAAERATYDAFVCGPTPFLKLAVAALRDLGFPRSRRHQERFVSLGGNPFGDASDDAAGEVDPG